VTAGKKNTQLFWVANVPVTPAFPEPMCLHWPARASRLSWLKRSANGANGCKLLSLVDMTWSDLDAGRVGRYDRSRGLRRARTPARLSTHRQWTEAQHGRPTGLLPCTSVKCKKHYSLAHHFALMKQKKSENAIVLGSISPKIRLPLKCYCLFLLFSC